jgi:uncharacterized protein
MRSALTGLLLFACMAATPAFGADEAPVPFLSGRVVDNAEILSGQARDRFTAMLQAHEQATGNQIAVLTVATIGGGAIEDYAVRVFEAWKLGKKGKDNGVLVVVVPQDRKIRIEVGYGLEGKLTDAAASRIIRDLMAPRFREGNYDVGVEAGITAVIQVLEGRTSVERAEWAVEPPGRNIRANVAAAPMDIAQRILIGLFVFGIIGLFTFLGLVTPGGTGWFLYAFLIPFWAAFPMFIVGGDAALGMAGAYLVLYPVVKIFLSRQDWYRKAREDLKKKGVARIGGFTIGGSSSSGGFSSGGGFSGGGGSSGGGGASGSW